MESILRLYKETDIPDYTQIPYNFNTEIIKSTYCYLPPFIMNSLNVTSLIIEQVNISDIDNISIIRRINLGTSNIQIEGNYSFMNKIEIDNDMINLLRKRGNYRYRIIANSLVYLSAVFQLSCFEEPVEPLILTLVGIDESNINSNDAIIKCNAAQGVYPYTFSKDDIEYQESNVFSSLDSGIYTIFCKDAENTKVSTQITLYAGLTVDVNITANSSEITPNGQIEFIITGGLVPYSTSINAGVNFNVSQTLYTGLADGKYYLVVRDSGNRQVELQVNVPKIPGELEANVNTDSKYFALELGTFAIDEILEQGDEITFNTNFGNFHFDVIAKNGTPLPGQVRAMDEIDDKNLTNLVTDLNLNSSFATLYDITTKIFGSSTNCLIIAKNQQSISNDYTISPIVLNTDTPQNSSIFSTQKGFKYNLSISAFGGVPPYLYKFASEDEYTSNNTTTLILPSLTNAYIKDSENTVVIVDTGVATTVGWLPYSIIYTYNNPTLTITFKGYYYPATYSLDGINYQSSNQFSVSPGSYTIYVKDAENVITTKDVTL